MCSSCPDSVGWYAAAFTICYYCCAATTSGRNGATARGAEPCRRSDHLCLRELVVSCRRRIERWIKTNPFSNSRRKETKKNFYLSTLHQRLSPFLLVKEHELGGRILPINFPVTILTYFFLCLSETPTKYIPAAHIIFLNTKPSLKSFLGTPPLLSSYLFSFCKIPGLILKSVVMTPLPPSPTHKRYTKQWRETPSSSDPHIFVKPFPSSLKKQKKQHHDGRDLRLLMFFERYQFFFSSFRFVSLFCFKVAFFLLLILLFLLLFFMNVRYGKPIEVIDMHKRHCLTIGFFFHQTFFFLLRPAPLLLFVDISRFSFLFSLTYIRCFWGELFFLFCK